MTTGPLPIVSLMPDPDQPRKSIPVAELDQLVESIRDRGLLLPLRVKPANAEGLHVIVSGHRRHAALLKLGATEAPCIIADGPLDEVAVLAEQLTENIVRQNLSPIEEAAACRRYIDLKHITAAQAAKELHVEPSRLSRLLPLLDLPEEVRAAIDRGVIPQETGYYLTRLPDGEERTRMIARAMAGALSRDEAARAARPRAGDGEPRGLTRVSLKLPGGRSVTICAKSVHLTSVVETLEDMLKQARKARQQNLDVTTLARILKDRAAPGGAS